MSLQVRAESPRHLCAELRGAAGHSEGPLRAFPGALPEGGDPRTHPKISPFPSPTRGHYQRAAPKAMDQSRVVHHPKCPPKITCHGHCPPIPCPEATCRKVTSEHQDFLLGCPRAWGGAGHPVGLDVEAEKSQGAGRWGLGPWLAEWGDSCRALGDRTLEQDWLESFTGEMGRGLFQDRAER